MRDQRRNRKAPLEQFMEGWLLWGNFSPKTRSWYREVFLGFVAWVRQQGGEGLLGELDPLLVRRWQYQLESNDHSINTVRGYLATLKSFSRYLAEERIVLDKDQRPLNLLSEVKVPKLPRSKPQTYQDDEVERILLGIDRHHLYGARNSALVRLMLDAGLRLNEACELRIDDIEWETGRVRVRWQSAKRRKERVTYVGRRTLLELRRYLEDFRPADAGIDQLFIDQDGGPLTRNAVRCMLKRLKEKLGLKRLTAHQFRRTWATNYRRMGVGDLYDLQQEGGWEDLSIPQRFYIEVDEPREGRVSVMDRWELERRKRERGRPIQAVAPVQVVQAVGLGKSGRPNGLKRAK
jgi:integrase/recombinase XerD